ncbi:hypothetical protein Cgig2_011967 [Carnegiea gigantea]|uniref:Uncharacterized protein n=1 Tax=Carnegiea gigantea TaxID=171969 RepID=A0A9Q1GN73_9CARY|nr:hypothetical protein Cgig2_011967 [Carnegiea gigantea]
MVLLFKDVDDGCDKSSIPGEGYTLIAIVGIKDPVCPGVKNTVQTCIVAGITENPQTLELREVVCEGEGVVLDPDNTWAEQFGTVLNLFTEELARVNGLSHEGESKKQRDCARVKRRANEVGWVRIIHTHLPLTEYHVTVSLKKSIISIHGSHHKKSSNLKLEATTSPPPIALASTPVVIEPIMIASVGVPTSIDPNGIFLANLTAMML